MSERFSIAHVTPYPWEAENEVNAHVRAVAGELSRRGHRVLIVAPSRSQERVRDSRRALRASRGDPSALLEGTDSGHPRRDGGRRGARRGGLARADARPPCP